MKFIADVMLGKLAKRLRLLGFDVLYDRTLRDNEIIRLSLEHGRVILTRDMAFTERPLAAIHLFISSDLVQEQVEQVRSFFSLGTHIDPLTRCSECNEPLVCITREEARDCVPRHVYEKNNRFQQCPQCDRIYWHGTHVANMAIPGRKRQQ